MDVYKSRSRKFLFTELSSHTTSEIRYLSADKPAGEWKLIAPRVHDQEYYVADHGDRFYIRTNLGGRNFGLMTAPISEPDRKNWKSLIPNREGEYAREVGDFLRVPVKFLAMDEAQFFERWEDPQLRWPEPIDDPFFAKNLDCYRNLSAECRVLLSGEGCDNLMDFQMWPYVVDMRRRGEWQRLLPDVANYLWVRPFPWRGIRARALRLAGKDPDRPGFPQWLALEFSRRTNLEARWKEHTGIPKSWMKHPIHPRGHASLSLPEWTNMFEQENAGATDLPVETRYPFLDLRIVNYLLALPPFPWFFQKMLLREAMAGRLPERVRTRPKTPLQGDPLLEQLKRTGAERLKSLSWSTDLDRYIDRSALVQPHGKMNPQQASVSSRPYSLNIWLQSARRVRYNIRAEAGNG